MEFSIKEIFFHSSRKCKCQLQNKQRVRKERKGQRNQEQNSMETQKKTTDGQVRNHSLAPHPQLPIDTKECMWEHQRGAFPPSGTEKRNTVSSSASLPSPLPSSLVITLTLSQTIATLTLNLMLITRSHEKITTKKEERDNKVIL